MATYYYETSTFEGNGMRNYNQTVQSAMHARLVLNQLGIVGASEELADQM
jgi:hypothetical protein